RGGCVYRLRIGESCLQLKLSGDLPVHVDLEGVVVSVGLVFSHSDATEAKELDFLVKTGTLVLQQGWQVGHRRKVGLEIVILMPRLAAHVRDGQHGSGSDTLLKSQAVLVGGRELVVAILDSGLSDCQNRQICGRYG